MQSTGLHGVIFFLRVCSKAQFEQEMARHEKKIKQLQERLVVLGVGLSG